MATKRTTSKQKLRLVAARGGVKSLPRGALEALRELRSQAPAVLVPCGNEGGGGWLDATDPMQVAARVPFGDYVASIDDDWRFTEYWSLSKQPTEYALLLDRLIDTPYAAKAWRAFESAVLDRDKSRDGTLRRRDPGNPGAMAVALFHALAGMWWRAHNEDRGTLKTRHDAAIAVWRDARKLRRSLKEHPEFHGMTGVLLGVRGSVREHPESVYIAPRLEGPGPSVPTTFEHVLDDFIVLTVRHIRALRDLPFQGQPRTDRAQLRSFARELSQWIKSNIHPHRATPPRDGIVGALTAAAFGLDQPLPATWLKNLRANETRARRT